MSLPVYIDQVLTKFKEDNKEISNLLSQKYLFLVLTVSDHLIYSPYRPTYFSNIKGVWVFNAKLLKYRTPWNTDEREYEIDIACVNQQGLQDSLMINGWEFSISGYYKYWNVGECLRLFAKKNNL